MRTSTPCARIRRAAGLLYAATQHGVYVSYDDGDAWQSLALNMPDVPVADLMVERNELVIATHGRGFWVLDNIAPLRQCDAGRRECRLHLFTPPVAVRSGPASAISWYLKTGADGGEARDPRLRRHGAAHHRAGFHARRLAGEGRDACRQRAVDSMRTAAAACVASGGFLPKTAAGLNHVSGTCAPGDRELPRDDPLGRGHQRARRSARPLHRAPHRRRQARSTAPIVVARNPRMPEVTRRRSPRAVRLLAEGARPRERRERRGDRDSPREGAARRSLHACE